MDKKILSISDAASILGVSDEVGSGMNDNGYSHKKIAKWIRKNPERVFTNFDSSSVDALTKARTLK